MKCVICTAKDDDDEEAKMCRKIKKYKNGMSSIKVKEDGHWVGY